MWWVCCQPLNLSVLGDFAEVLARATPHVLLTSKEHSTSFCDTHHDIVALAGSMAASKARL